MSKKLIISLIVLISSFSSFYSVQLNSTTKLSNNQTINEIRFNSSNLSTNSSSNLKSSSLNASVNSSQNDKIHSNDHTNDSSNISFKIDANQSLIVNSSIDSKSNQNLLNADRALDIQNNPSNNTNSLLNAIKLERKHKSIEIASSNNTNQSPTKFNDINRVSLNLNHTDRSLQNSTNQTLVDLNKANQTLVNLNDTNQTVSTDNRQNHLLTKLNNNASQIVNDTSSVGHLLSNDDIKEYQIKRKEENEMKKVHLKELKTKGKDKIIETLPIRKNKLSQDIETNDINHLQEIDVIDDVEIVKETHKPQLIVVSLDAFRYDYIKLFKNHVSNFVRMAKLGVSAPFGIIPAYVTQTFASHYSIATGLWQESNGIIDNRFYDPKFQESFKPWNLKSKFFDGEPIWNTAVKNNLESRVYYWPGSEAVDGIKGLKPTEYMKFNLTTSIKDQIEKVIEWAENGTDLCMMYNGEPDYSGHNFGIGSKEMSAAIKEINHELGILIDYVQEKNINLIVTGDHGMVTISRDKIVILEDYLDFKNEIVRIPQFGSIAAIQPKEGKLDQVMEKLSKVPFIKCYKKEDIPERFHYKNHYRIQPIICIAEVSAFVVRTKEDAHPSVTPQFGIHGYDNRLPSMRPLFFAIGPDFKSSFITYPFENINLYSLFSHILNIEPAPNNGSIHNIKHILSETSLSRLQDRSIVR